MLMRIDSCLGAFWTKLTDKDDHADADIEKRWNMETCQAIIASDAGTQWALVTRQGQWG